MAQHGSCARRDGQHSPRLGRPRALASCKRGLGFLDNHAEQRNTITTDLRFALKTLECVTFATGWSSAYPRVLARHSGSNDGYASQPRLTMMALRGQPPSTAKRARIDGDYGLGGALSWAAAASGFPWWRRDYSGEPMPS